MKPFAPVVEGAKKFAGDVTNKATKIAKDIKGGQDKLLEKVKPFVPETNLAILSDNYVNQGYDEKAVKFLKAHGGDEIKSIKIRRAPIAKMLEYAFQAISMGTWFSAKKKTGYDKIFHLSLIINDTYVIQKLARVTLAPKDPDMPNSEFKDVPLKGRLYISEMMEKTLNAVGQKTYFSYHPFTNNCQDFVYSILKANDLLDPEASIGNFVVQPVESLVKRMPSYTASVLHTMTNAGAITGIGSGKPDDMKGSGNPGAEEEDYEKALADYKKQVELRKRIGGKFSLPPPPPKPELKGGAKPDDDRMGANYNPNASVKGPQLVDVDNMRRMLDGIRKFESTVEAGSKKETLSANAKKAEQLLSDVLADRTSLANEKKFDEMYQLFRASRSLVQG
jgi:hypothetical protein